MCDFIIHLKELGGIIKKGRPMKIETKIKGDKNIVIQGIKNSKINIQNENKDLTNKRTYTLIGIIITVLGLIATIIIGWDNIINFFA